MVYETQQKEQTMYIELSIFAIISAIMLFGFIFSGVAKFGLLRSYSAYAQKWATYKPLNNISLWSVITIVSAFLICPVLIELGVGTVWQFLGFLVPVYLIVIGLTPEFETKEIQFWIHVFFSVLCFLGGLGWVFFVMHAGRLFAGVVAFVLTIALMTGTFRSSAIFWTEMTLFLSVYLIVLLAIV